MACLLSIVWVRLYAPDVALTEAAIGGGVTGVLLVTAAMRLRGRAVRRRQSRLRRAALRWRLPCFASLVAAALAAVVLSLPDPGPTLAPEADRHLAATGLGNPVTAV